MTTPTTAKSEFSENCTRTPHQCASACAAEQKPLQFDIQSLLWLTVTIGIALMYLRPLGQRAMMEATSVIAVAAAAGLVVGTMRGRIGDVVYWSVLGAAFAFISTVASGLAHWTAPFAWASVGMVTGCAVSSYSESRWLRCVVAGGLSAGLVMSIYAIFLYRFTGAFDGFDLACSAPIGAFFGLLVMSLRQVQLRSALRYDATATLLMAAIVVGNYLSRLVAPIVILVALVSCLPGCSEPASTDDPAPFEAAVADYLSKNDMALRLKKIRQGPTVEGDQATMSASMTHRDLGGPSVVWTFQFQRTNAAAQWMVVSHSDK